MRNAGGVNGFGELQLRNPDRILIAHTHRHQPPDFAQRRVFDATPADEAPQPVDIELSVSRALILDQHVDGIADFRRNRFRQSLR